MQRKEIRLEEHVAQKRRVLLKEYVRTFGKPRPEDYGSAYLYFSHPDRRFHASDFPKGAEVRPARYFWILNDLLGLSNPDKDDLRLCPGAYFISVRDYRVGEAFERRGEEIFVPGKFNDPVVVQFESDALTVEECEILGLS